MPEDDIQRRTDGERGRFIQLLRQVETEFWRITKERDDLQRELDASRPSLDDLVRRVTK